MNKSALRMALQWAWALTYLQAGSFLCWALVPARGRFRAWRTPAKGYGRHVAWLWDLPQEVRGWEALPKAIRDGRQPVVFIANHASALDPLMLGINLPTHFLFMPKREMVYVPVLGWVTWLWGCIFIDRHDHARALASMELAAARIRGGESILTFPEGTRTRDGRLLPFKKGAFHLARQARVPVIPLGLRGTFELMPRGTWRIQPGPFVLNVGQPLEPGAFEDVEAFRDAAEAAVRDLVQTAGS
jgi:1-acyl-sn-glycerol-3-phosphate acyltransferase